LSRRFPVGVDVAPAWRWCYDLVQPLLGELGEGELLWSGIHVAAAGSLDTHPIWNWLIKYTLRAAAEMVRRHGKHGLDVFVVLGLIVLWRASRRSHIRWSSKLLVGSFLIGFEIFNLVEGVVDHHLLAIHHAESGVASSVVSWPVWAATPIGQGS
jgi:Predicted membrane protein (DUF2243)